tara:strand:+ start:3405 stop:3806 length:402 start_codon:yes stop_codon:yes gene_type:complete
MIKTSKVARVTGNGTWEGKFGLMYKFEIEMENGDLGENMSKSQECKFKEGETTEYEFIDGQYPKIKPVNNFQPKANYSSSGSDVQENIRWAQSLNIANLQLCHKLITNSEVEEVAVEWYNRLKNGKPEILPFS